MLIIDWSKAGYRDRDIYRVNFKAMAVGDTAIGARAMEITVVRESKLEQSPRLEMVCERLQQDLT